MGIVNKAQITSQIDNPDGGKIDLTTFSNVCITTKVESDFIVEKTAQKDWALPKEKITVTTKITNNSNLTIQNFTFKDTLSPSASFVPGTVKISDEPKPTFNPITGFSSNAQIGGFGAFAEITYEIQISEYPEESVVKNKTGLTLTFDSQEFSLTSNEKEISIVENEVYLLKECSPVAVVSGNEMTYTITITNEGSLENTNIVFSDSIPSDVTFVNETVVVNGTPQPTYNPTTGFPLPNLPANGTITISFKVQVN